MRKIYTSHGLSEKEFEKFFRQYYKLAIYISVKVTNNASASEDIVQDVFFNIWKNPEQINPSKSLKSYLLTSVKNRSLNYLRNTKPTTDIFALPNNFMDVEYDFSNEEKMVVILSEIDKLPPKCGEIFKLVVLHEKKYKQVAEALNISLNTVKTQMGIAYKQLRNINTDIF